MNKTIQGDVREQTDMTDEELVAEEGSQEAVDQMLAAQRKKVVAVYASYGWSVLQSYGSRYKVEKEFADELDIEEDIDAELEDIREKAGW
jgi:hypothetical protein